MEAHSTQKGQPPRMHGPGLWKYEQKEQRVTPVPLSGGNCNLWRPGWDSKDEQIPCGLVANSVNKEKREQVRVGGEIHATEFISYNIYTKIMIHIINPSGF